MTDERPDPDALLARVSAQEAKARRGRLKVFLGASAGVGKTFAMLEAARKAREDGRDVVVGWVETHGREETARLAEGLERLPSRAERHRGIDLPEFDLDAALARRPDLVLLDELAHTNAPGSRHAKRWQDALELLDAGLDVYSTLNVQHLESLNDVVAQITGVTVRETVPDSLLRLAEEVELIDLPPDELIERLRAGKVYVPEQARQAIEGFFRKGNLIALRELALRRTAERVDEQMRDYRRDHGIEATWPAAERLLVCVGPNPAAGRLIRAAKRMADGLRAQWIALYVEAPSHAGLPESDRVALAANLRLAESLGGATAMLSGPDVARQILLYAREHNVGRILAGKPTHPRWRDRLRGSLVDALVRGSGDIDIYVISGDVDAGTPARRAPSPPPVRRWSEYGIALVVVAVASALCLALFPTVSATNLAMVYLLGVTFVATRASRAPAALASVLSVLAFDVLFVPPRFRLAVEDSEYLLTFGVMLLIALLISTLAGRVRAQADIVRERERRTAALYALGRDLAQASDIAEAARVACTHVADAAGARLVLILTAPNGGPLAPLGHEVSGAALSERDRAVAQWVLDHGRRAGLGTDTLPAASCAFFPLTTASGVLGVLAVEPDTRNPTWDQGSLIDGMASQIAAALERDRLAEIAQRSKVDAEAERLRNSLLSSVSHDLRTPLASITGAASSLLEDLPSDAPASRRELLSTIHEESLRLNRLVANLLDMTRVESGALELKKDWVPVEEIVGGALLRTEAALAGRPVEMRVAPDLPLVPMDALLIEQLLVNLIENAVKYSPPGSPVLIGASRGAGCVEIEVSDRGPGIPEGEQERIFEKFRRLEPRGPQGGVGLGLAICRGIAEAHGGSIRAENRQGGGARIVVILKAEGAPSTGEPKDEEDAE